MRISLTGSLPWRANQQAGTVPRLQTSSDGDTIWTQCRVIRKGDIFAEEPTSGLGKASRDIPGFPPGLVVSRWQVQVRGAIELRWVSQDPNPSRHSGVIQCCLF